MENKNNDKILCAIIAYFWIPGWLIALLMYGSYKSFFNKFHLKQSLILHILSAITLTIDFAIDRLYPAADPVIWIINLIIFAMYIDGLIMAFSKKVDFVFGTKQIFKLIFHENLNN